MKRILDIVESVELLAQHGDLNQQVAGLCLDSREVHPGFGYIALRGLQHDGHDFIEAAVAAGASLIVGERLPEQRVEGVVYLCVADAAQAAGWMGASFYDHPSRQMTLVGITGTNGKTTVATLLYQLFLQQGKAAGLISTVSIGINGSPRPATHTTPHALALQSLFYEMKQEGCQYVFMEVSSHAIDQQRIAGIQFDVGVFTNLSHDHLDYHGDFKTYMDVKKRFFDQLPATAYALANLDDRRAHYLLQNTRAKRAYYSLQSPADIKGKVLENRLYGLMMQVNAYEAHFLLLGLFNAYNILAVFGVAQWLGMDPLTALSGLSKLRGAPGRMETQISTKDRILGIVDYAHTPDALRNVLVTIDQFREDGQRLLTVLGCGGDRDNAKRPLMAALAARYSDQVVLTSDNPRGEDPESILDDMEKGLEMGQKKKVLRIVDRREAIRTASMLAGPGDIILVAGKGHETYQEIRGKRMEFDDRWELKKQWEALDK